MPQKIALFGGAFDPIHNGHIRLALEFARRLGLDRVLLMPSYVPPHKLRGDMAGPADRLHMCRLAAAEHPGLEVSDLEIARGGASFTADTLDTLRGQYPEAVWYLITGADMFLTLGALEHHRRAIRHCAPRRGMRPPWRRCGPTLPSWPARERGVSWRISP